MFRCRGIIDGVKPVTGSVFGAVLSSVEIQVPSFHPLVFVIFSLMDSRSHSWITPHPAEMPSSQAASEILYVVRLFSFISLRYSVPGYFSTGISKGSQFRYWDSGADAPEDPCTSEYTL